MPAGRRAFPHAQDEILFIHLLLFAGLLARLLIGLLVRLPILPLLLLALLALTLLLVTVRRGLRVAVLGIVHRWPSMALAMPGIGRRTSRTHARWNGLPALSFIPSNPTHKIRRRVDE